MVDSILSTHAISGFCFISYSGSFVLLLVVCVSFADYQAWFYYGFLSTIEL